MIVAAHQTMMARAEESPPTKFNFIGVKLCANRQIHVLSSLSAYRANGMEPGIQISEIDIISASSSRYSWPSDMTVSNYTAFDGERHYSTPTLMSNYSSGIGAMFNTSTATKWYGFNSTGYNATYANVVDYDTGVVLMQSGGTYDATFREQHFGVGGRFTPVCLVLDVSSSPIDMSVYSKWRFYNGNDSASQTSRTWIEGEILGSNDKLKWWRLDVFNDASIPNTNYRLAYTGSFSARSGDLWFGLDLATRDWTNGVSTN